MWIVLSDYSNLILLHLYVDPNLIEISFYNLSKNKFFFDLQLKVNLCSISGLHGLIIQ